jgi:hypothetical protein
MEEFQGFEPNSEYPFLDNYVNVIPQLCDATFLGEDLNPIDAPLDCFMPSSTESEISSPDSSPVTVSIDPMDPIANQDYLNVFNDSNNYWVNEISPPDCSQFSNVEINSQQETKQQPIEGTTQAQSQPEKKRGRKRLRKDYRGNKSSKYHKQTNKY